MRERNRASSYKQLCKVHSTDGVNPDITYSYDVDCGKTEHMLDELTPGYHSLIREGKSLPVNYCKKTTTMILPMASSLGWTSTTHMWGGRTHYSSAYAPALAHLVNSGTGPVFNTNPPLAPPDWEPLLQKSLAQAKTPSWDVGTFAAEFSKTLDLVVNFRKRLLKTMSDVMSSKTYKTRARRSLTAFSDTWLEYRYGWRLLAYDIEEVNSSLTKLQEGVKSLGIRRVTSHGVNTITNSTSSSRAGGIPGAGGPWDMTVSTVFRTESHTRSGLGIEGVARDLAFIDPLVTGWEIIPWSFILDWFFNLGDMITAWSPFASGNVMWAWSSTNTQSIKEVTCTPLPVRLNRYYVAGPVTGADTCVSVTDVYERNAREPTVDLSFRLNLDWAKIIDIGALLRSNRHKFIR